MKKIFISLVISLLLTLVFSKNYVKINNAIRRRLCFFQKEQTSLPTPIKLINPPSSQNDSLSLITPTPLASQELKDEVSLEVPFISQAPLKHWDTYHEDLCEEAAILMVAASKNKANPISKKEMEEELTKIVEFEKSLFNGRWQSTTAEEIALVLQKKFDINARVLENFSIEDLKKELSEGHLIIAPTYGRALKNPFYTPPGPIYHAVVVKGYKKNQFITNDPGTNQAGKDYLYEEKLLFEAIHDWPGKTEDVPLAVKRVVIVY